MKFDAVTIAAVSLSLALAGCTQTDSDGGSATASLADDCANAAMIGRFDPTKDLLVANYDSKPDVDDLQAVAGLGSVLKHPDFACVDFIATSGAYGIQAGTYLPAAKLFNLAFGEKWLDAHENREASVKELARLMTEALERGGKVWVAEAGQSDVTAAAVRLLPEDKWRDVHIVQHSYWNESQTSPDAMNTVVYNTTYHRIQDGNFADNGTPAFNTEDNSHWEPILADKAIGPVWAEAKRLSELHNPVAEYVNPAVEAGGLDFSDAVEISYIFGFEDMAGVGEFVERFAVGK